MDTDVLIDWEQRWELDQHGIYNISQIILITLDYIFPTSEFGLKYIWIPRYVEIELKRVGRGRRFLNTLMEEFNVFHKCCIRNNENNIREYGKGFVDPSTKANYGDVDALLQLKFLIENIQNLPCKTKLQLKKRFYIRIALLTADMKLYDFAKSKSLQDYLILWQKVVSDNYRLYELFPERKL